MVLFTDFFISALRRHMLVNILLDLEHLKVRALHLCDMKYKGIKPAEEELKKILADHAAWIRIVYLPAIEGKSLKELIEVNIEDLPQEGRANLCCANLSEAVLRGTNLSGANLERVDLSRANLADANLSGANLFDANLSSAILSKANMRSTYLDHANLSNAVLMNANLSGASLLRANLRGAYLRMANLSKANLYYANLSEAYLFYVNLSGAHLKGTNLSKADLMLTNMDSVRFELEIGLLPSVLTIAWAENLSKMRYGDSPQSLVELRDAFKKAGLRQQEREITYAIEHTRTLKQILGEEGDGGIVLGCLKFIGFELTSNYGMSPGRPLWIIIVLILFFSVPYEIVLKNTQGRAGIWQVWSRDRVLKDDGQEVPIRLCANEPHKTSWFAFYFSLLSAFHIGWREFNIGNWIVRMQGREYTLRATGWVRTVSGVQSLISVYLMALSVLTYFGRPFE